MKIIIFGSSLYTLSVLELISKTNLSNIEIKLVSNSGIHFKKLETSIYNSKTQYEADLIVSIGFSEKLNIQNLISKYGCLNIHQSILPEYRGRHPIQAMILNGELNYGTTLHYLDQEFDTGDIVKILKKEYYYLPTESIVKKLVIKQSAELFTYMIQNCDKLKSQSFKQNLKPTNFAPKRKPSDSEIKSNFKLNYVERMFKALTTDPYKPYLLVNNNKIYISKIYKRKRVGTIEFQLEDCKVYLQPNVS